MGASGVGVSGEEVWERVGRECGSNIRMPKSGVLLSTQSKELKMV